MRPRGDTDAMASAQAERELIIRDPVAHARALALDPDFRSVDGQALPDRFYVAARKLHPKDTGAQVAYLQAAIKRRNLRDIGAGNLRAQRGHASNPHRMSRADAALHTALKTGGASMIMLCALWLITDPANVAMAASFALTFTVARVAFALLTREVF